MIPAHRPDQHGCAHLVPGGAFGSQRCATTVDRALDGIGVLRPRVGRSVRHRAPAE